MLRMADAAGDWLDGDSRIDGDPAPFVTFPGRTAAHRVNEYLFVLRGRFIEPVYSPLYSPHVLVSPRSVKARTGGEGARAKTFSP